MSRFSHAQIEDINATVVRKPDEYFVKRAQFPPCPVKAWDYKWANHDFPRTWCILDFIEWLDIHGLANVGSLAYTCDSDPELEFITCAEKTLLSYPPVDLHDLSEYTNRFDFFIFNQTLEHLYNPFSAMKQIYDTLKPGGYVFTSVPTLNIPHCQPFHFNGFTPMGLTMLFMVTGFQVVETGQWGNYEYIQKMWANHAWPGFADLQKNGVVTNEEKNVCQCWILARKPL